MKKDFSSKKDQRNVKLIIIFSMVVIPIMAGVVFYTFDLVDMKDNCDTLIKATHVEYSGAQFEIVPENYTDTITVSLDRYWDKDRYDCDQFYNKTIIEKAIAFGMIKK